MASVARKNGVAGESAGVENRIGQVGDELVRVATLQTKSEIHCGFDGLLFRYLKQHDRFSMCFQEQLKLVIAGCEVNPYAILLKRAVERSGETGVIAGEKNPGDR